MSNNTALVCLGIAQLLTLVLLFRRTRKQPTFHIHPTITVQPTAEDFAAVRRNLDDSVNEQIRKATFCG